MFFGFVKRTGRGEPDVDTFTRIGIYRTLKKNKYNLLTKVNENKKVEVGAMNEMNVWKWVICRNIEKDRYRGRIGFYFSLYYYIQCY